MRLVLVGDAAMMGLAVLDSVAQIRRTQQEALEHSLQEAQRNLDPTRRPSEPERNYAPVTTLATANPRRHAEWSEQATKTPRTADTRSPAQAPRGQRNRIGSARHAGDHMPAEGLQFRRLARLARPVQRRQ